MSVSGRGYLRKRPIDILTPEELQALYSAPGPRSRTGIRNRALLRVLGSTGLRPSSALTLSPDDVDPERLVLAIEDPDSKRHRYVQAPASTFDALERWQAHRDRLAIPRHAALFCTRDGRRFDQGYVRAMLTRMRGRASVHVPSIAKKRVNPDGLRATWLVHSRYAGWSLEALRRQMGTGTRGPLGRIWRPSTRY